MNARHSKTGLLELSCILFTLAASLLLVRSYSEVGWGYRPIQVTPHTSTYGIAWNSGDNLTYASFAQQARLGVFPFYNLYTIEPHSPILVNFFFLCVGLASRWFSVHPVFILNIVGFVSALLTIVFVFSISLQIKASRRAALFSAILVAFGSGLSWVSASLNHFLGLSLAEGADTDFLDLIPSAAFQTFPYHSAGTALLVALLCLVLRCEEVLRNRRKPFLWVLMLFIAAQVLTATRPYEPIVLLIIYTVYLMLTGLRKSGLDFLKPRLIIAFVMALAVIPMTVYSYWVSTQPIWHEYSNYSLSLQRGRVFWLLGFGLTWPAGLFGIYLAHIKKRPFATTTLLLSLWGLFAFALLVLFNSPRTKLAGGSFIVLSLLSGITADELLDQTQRVSSVMWNRFAHLFLILCLFASLLGTALICRRLKNYRPTIDTEILSGLEIIRDNTSEPIPRVLTDGHTGSVVPGLAGMAVYGVWPPMTIHIKEKLEALAMAGLNTGASSDTDTCSTMLMGVSEILRQGDFRFALLGKDWPLYACLRTDRRFKELSQGSRWAVLEVRRNPDSRPLN